MNLFLNNGFQSNKTQVNEKIVLQPVSWQAKQVISADSTRMSLICIPVIDVINYLKVKLAAERH